MYRRLVGGVGLLGGCTLRILAPGKSSLPWESMAMPGHKTPEMPHAAHLSPAHPTPISPKASHPIPHPAGSPSPTSISHPKPPTTIQPPKTKPRPAVPRIGRASLLPFTESCYFSSAPMQSTSLSITLERDDVPPPPPLLLPQSPAASPLPRPPTTYCAPGLCTTSIALPWRSGGGPPLVFLVLIELSKAGWQTVGPLQSAGLVIRLIISVPLPSRPVTQAFPIRF